MRDNRKLDVVTIYECYGDHCYLMKISKSPDTEQSKQFLRERVTRLGASILVCANFDDVIKRATRIALDIYDEVHSKHYRGDWFVVEQGKLDTRFLRQARRR